MTSMTPRPRRLVQTRRRASRAGDREGKTIRFPSLPRVRASRAIAAGRARRPRRDFGDGSRPAAREPTLDEIRVVGLDAEQVRRREVPSRRCSWRRATARSSSTRWRSTPEDAEGERAATAADASLSTRTSAGRDDTQNRIRDSRTTSRGFVDRTRGSRLRATRRRRAWWTLAPSPSSRFAEKRKLATRGSSWDGAPVAGASWIRRNRSSVAETSARLARSSERRGGRAASHGGVRSVACAAPDAIAAALATRTRTSAPNRPRRREAKVADTRRRRRRRRRKRSIGRRPVRR